ncbi:MAG: hypothetical protein JSW73_01755 [Candidatus Woesearchaeota archaeon]|nr:MAG: hypothetical protein JSW73_01755 [Candidatus Woesearchaeota archaeon]
MNRKGITPLVAIILLMMITVAAGGAAYYWLDDLQEKTQAVVSLRHERLIREATASLASISKSFDRSNEILELDVENNGRISVSANAEEIIGIIIDKSTEDAMCASMDLNSTNFYCNPATSCNGPIFPNSVKRLTIDISNCGNLISGTVYYYELRFEKGAYVFGYFLK